MNKEEKAELKKIWRFRWLGELFTFSHLEYLRGLWIEHKYPNAVGFFSEDMCRYFDDLVIDNNYEWQLNEGIINEDEFRIIERFHVGLDNYQKECRKDLEILEDPEFLKIVEEGTKAWDILKKVITNKEELNHMNGLERNYLTKE